MTPQRPHCAKPDACAATGRGHCRRCALLVNPEAMAAGRRLGGTCSLAKLHADPGFRERVRARGRALVAFLNRDPDIVARRTLAIRATWTSKAANLLGVPVDLIGDYRFVTRTKKLTREQALGVLERSFPAAFDTLPDSPRAVPVHLQELRT